MTTRHLLVGLVNVEDAQRLVAHREAEHSDQVVVYEVVVEQVQLNLKLRVYGVVVDCPRLRVLVQVLVVIVRREPEYQRCVAAVVLEVPRHLYFFSTR